MKQLILQQLKKPIRRYGSRRYETTKQLNQAVNLDKEAIYVAIPKTGSTSIRSQMSSPPPYLIPIPHLDILQIRDSLYTFILLRYLGVNTAFPSKDHTDDADIRNLTKETFEKFFKFASVRNPWARAVSLYFRSEGLRISERMSFEAFCDQHLYASDTCIHPTRHRSQLDWVVDESRRLAVDHVFRIEDLSEKIHEIRELSSGRVCLSMDFRNVNIRSRSREYREMYNSNSKKIIVKRFEEDIDYFKYTF